MSELDYKHFLKIVGTTISAVALTAPLLGAVGASPATAGTLGGFRTTYALASARSHATATQLEDGDVLVAGGQGPSGAALSSAEVYRASTGSWAPVEPMPVPVTQATATLLANGDVLVAGGLTGGAGALVPTSASQLFDPSTGQWSLSQGRLAQASFGASAARLPSGQVLYAGGLPSTSASARATTTSEVYNPSTGQWSTTSAMPVGVAYAQMAVLATGNVLVAGGEKGPSAGVTNVTQVFEPSGAKWATSTHMPVAVADAASAVLKGGDVLVAGGETATNGTPTNITQVFDPTDVTWRTGGALPQASYGATANLLASGEVLYAGGMTGPNDSAPTADAELFSLSTGKWAPTGPLVVPEGFGAAANLPGGDVVVAGGEGAAGPTAAVQVYEPALTSVAPAITSSATFDLTAGQPDTFTVTTIGSPLPSLKESGVLPPGMVFHDNGNGTATISGTPPAGTHGTYAVTITASNGVGNPAVQQLTLVVFGVAAVPKVTSPAIFNVLAGRYNSFTVTTTGSPVPVINELGALPPGMVFHDNRNGTASISGAPPVGTSGTYRVTIVASNSAGTSPLQQLSLVVTNVLKAPSITSPSTFHVIAGQTNSFTITANGSPAPSISLAGELPPGMSFHDNGNGTATVFGVPPSGTRGTYRVTLSASNAVGPAAVEQVSFTFGNPAVITSAAQMTVQVGRYTSFTVTTSGSPVPQLSESGALPPGLSFHYNDNGTATIAGIVPVNARGTYTVLVTASNGVGKAAVQHLVVQLLVPPKPPAIVSAPAFLLFSGRRNVVTIRTSGSPVPTVTVSGALPPGMSFHANANGTASISGVVPAGAKGTYRLVVKASNGGASPAVQVLSLMVGNPGQPTAPSGVGYWYTTADGTVLGAGAAVAMAPSQPQHPEDIVGMAVTPARTGYYLVSKSGGVFAYGKAHWYGSVRGRHLSTPTVAIAVTPFGGGYYLVTRAGNVFAFGDARWHGSTAGRHLAPIASMAVTPNGGGYWLVSVYGNIYAFGNARFFGSPANRPVPPVVALQPTPNGQGYWVVTSHGNVFAYGNARFYGSTAVRHISDVAAFGTTPDGRGYWLVTNNGQVFNYGDAPSFGSSASRQPLSEVTGFAVDD